MKTVKFSLRRITSVLNDPDEDGGLWLPNIQRPFVWSEGQICKLFDSILREYPISTLLVWKTKDSVRSRRFIDNFKKEQLSKLSDFFVPENNKKKGLVLDGQQRLQALFIGLRGSYEGKELYLNLLSGTSISPDDMAFQFSFRHQAADDQTRVPLQLRKVKDKAFWYRFKDIVFETRDPLTAAKAIISSSPVELTEGDQERVSRNIGLIFKTFQGDDGILFQELDSIDAPTLYNQDDIVEIFIRANSGGTVLGKSDLLFALLSAAWDHSNEAMEELLDDVNSSGFIFTRDFVLKACLSILDQGARYEVQKFRQSNIREEIESEWERIGNSIRDVLDALQTQTYIRCDSALPSYNMLIPIIYYRYHFPKIWQKTKGLDTYVLRTLIAGAFSGTPDQLIDEITSDIRTRESFDIPAIFEIIRSKNRSLEITEERLWRMGYGSENIHLLFNIWYKQFNYTPSFSKNMPQVDHIFPQSELRKIKKLNPITFRRDLIRYKQHERDQLANCMLITASENGAGQKGAQLPEDWFAGKPTSYLKMHLIPEDPELWKIENYERFIEARQILIKEHLKEVLTLTTDAL